MWSLFDQIESSKATTTIAKSNIISMKLSVAATALLVLALGAPPAVEARGTRRTTRRAQEQADVAATPDDELVVTPDGPENAGGNNVCKYECVTDKIEGIIHLTVPPAPDTPEPCCDSDGVGGNYTGGDYYYYYNQLISDLVHTVPTEGTITLIWNDFYDIDVKNIKGTIDPNTCLHEKARIDYPINSLTCAVGPNDELTVKVSKTQNDPTCQFGGHSCECPDDSDDDGILISLDINYGSLRGVVNDFLDPDPFDRRLESDENSHRNLVGHGISSRPTTSYLPGVNAALICGAYTCASEHNYTTIEGFRSITDNEFLFDEPDTLSPVGNVTFGIMNGTIIFPGGGIGGCGSSDPLSALGGTKYFFDLAECNIDRALSDCP